MQQEAAPDAAGAAGSAEGSKGGPEWEAWNASRKAAGTADPRWQGLPAGSELIQGTICYRSPNNDFMYRRGWQPKSEAWIQDGRNYLTKESQHARN
eukprot:8514903-Heterocapsa_arctica.AAC.1